LGMILGVQLPAPFMGRGIPLLLQSARPDAQSLAIRQPAGYAVARIRAHATPYTFPRLRIRRTGK
jgi:hypothetical protein